MSMYCRNKRFWIAIFICAACGTVATPMPTPSLEPRPVAVTIQPDPRLTQTPQFDPEFSVVARKSRDIEGFCVQTNQGHYWEPGDTLETDQPHLIEVMVDGRFVFARDHLFMFWNNSNSQEVHDDEGNLLGSYLTSGMSICFSTRTLSLGRHNATIQIISTSGVVHSYSWRFEIAGITRSPIPPMLVPTAQYLEQNPQPTPEFIQRLPITVSYLDRFTCITSFSEGLLIHVGDGPIEGGGEQWDIIDISIDGSILSPDGVHIGTNEMGDPRICVDTGFFESGLHLATIAATTTSGNMYSYSWAFRIE